ncbi:MAG: hypothetical protein ACI93R_002366 [Flavobacteriales bacterium]|jgi:uncharacterized protein (DUF2141 family)
MNKLALALFSTLISVTAFAADTAKTISVKVEGIHKASGTIYLTGYNNSSDFSAFENPTFSQVHVVTKKSETLEITIPSDGEYAFSVYVDQNANDKIDSNAMGIPKEPYAFSGNVSPFGPPSYEAAKVDVKSGDTLILKVR